MSKEYPKYCIHDPLSLCDKDECRIQCIHNKLSDKKGVQKYTVHECLVEGKTYIPDTCGTCRNRYVEEKDYGKHICPRHKSDDGYGLIPSLTKLVNRLTEEAAMSIVNINHSKSMEDLCKINPEDIYKAIKNLKPYGDYDKEDILCVVDNIWRLLGGAYNNQMFDTEEW